MRGNIQSQVGLLPPTYHSTDFPISKGGEQKMCFVHFLCTLLGSFPSVAFAYRLLSCAGYFLYVILYAAARCCCTEQCDKSHHRSIARPQCKTEHKAKSTPDSLTATNHGEKRQPSSGLVTRGWSRRSSEYQMIFTGPM